MPNLATLPEREDGFVRKKWTVDECRNLVESGLLEAGKFELIEGEIIFKMGQGRIHIAAVTRIIAILSSVFGAASIQSQAQIGIGETDPFSDPEPDVAVLRGTVDDYLEREPRPADDILLAVEAANTTVVGDTTTKVRLYASNGIQEYWVVVIPRSVLVVYREPVDGLYTDVRTYSWDDSVCPLARPESPISVRDLLPARSPAE